MVFCLREKVRRCIFEKVGQFQACKKQFKKIVITFNHDQPPFTPKYLCFAQDLITAVVP